MVDSISEVSHEQYRDDLCWDHFVAVHPYGHLLQTSGWAELKSRFGWRSEQVKLGKGFGDKEARALLLFRRAAGLQIAYVPRGPVVDWRDAELTTAMLERLIHTAHAKGAAVLKLEPSLVDSAENRALLRSHDFAPSMQSIQPRSTIVLDISDQEDAVLAQMKSKWRYNIRLSKRKEITVREAQPADLPAFARLMQETGSRDGFAVHSSEYYRAAYELFVPDQAAFLMAEYAGTPVAGLVVFAVGIQAWYLWGASSNRERNRMPNHGLQWAAIQWARARGATRYDFWGIPDDIGKLSLGLLNRANGVPPEQIPLDLKEIPHGELWGVYRFKQGFGGRVVRMVGAWDRPIQPLQFRAYQVGLTLRNLQREFSATSPQEWPAQAVQLLQSNGAAPILAPPIRVSTASDWHTVLAQWPRAHLLQGWDWGEIKEQSSWEAHRFQVGPASQPIGAFQLLTRRVAETVPLRIGYVAKGPICTWSSPKVMDNVLAAVEAQARRLNCIFVKIDPDIREDSEQGKLFLHALSRRGWHYSADQIQFKNTALTDLTVGEEALLAGMKSKWRYNVRLAKRRGIVVRSGDEGDLDAFFDLYAETSKRDGFLIRPRAYYLQAWRRYLQVERNPENPAGGALLLAEHPDETRPLAALFLMRHGTCNWYFYGASSERRRRDMPNYLLQWEALRWSIAAGCTVYDWWGAPTDLDDVDDRMAGVWRFKQGFGARFQPHIGAWDYPVQPLLYRAYAEIMPKVLGRMRRGTH